MPPGVRRRAVEDTAVVVVDRRVAPEEEALRKELEVRRTAKKPVLHRAVVLPVDRRAGRKEKAEEVRHMVVEGQESRTDWVDSRPVVGAEEEDIGPVEAVDSSPGYPLGVLLVVSVQSISDI
jgi:hypothetical protein